MLARRGISAALLIGAATLSAAGTATANPLPLESPTPTSTEPVAGGLCNADPLLALWCLIASPSA
ncbi:hypothetical protein ACQP1O_10840 [Nocardia sp. CA-151230]|uniref:hypothetical protein n=1 Tax=Nocardia sp. CA-151230 TaxID=3239982 RepID=UPI003D947B41